jgi:hypothetical protein
MVQSALYNIQRGKSKPRLPCESALGTAQVSLLVWSLLAILGARVASKGKRWRVGACLTSRPNKGHLLMKIRSKTEACLPGDTLADGLCEPSHSSTAKLGNLTRC